MSHLAERVERVRLLLATLNDPYPPPKPALEPDSGPSRSRYVPCETCRRTGRVRVHRAKTMICLGCDGYGWRRREHADDDWDHYLELPLREAATLPRAPGARARVLLEPEPEPPFAWERRKEVYDRHGSYRELREALAWLRRHDPVRYYLVDAVLVQQQPRTLTETDRMNVDLGVIGLALRMRNVRVPSWLLERSRAAEKRETIEALVAEGLRAGEIAKRLGMSKEVVRRRIRAVNSRHAGIPQGAM